VYTLFMPPSPSQTLSEHRREYFQLHLQGQHYPNKKTDKDTTRIDHC
jgi:hypothetical protein